MDQERMGSKKENFMGKGGAHVEWLLSALGTSTITINSAPDAINIFCAESSV